MSLYENNPLYPDVSAATPPATAYLWGVVATDNFARETVADTWVVQPILYKEQAARVCEILRENSSSQSAHWYKVAYLGQRLNRGMYDLV